MFNDVLYDIVCDLQSLEDDFDKSRLILSILCEVLGTAPALVSLDPSHHICAVV